MEEELNKYIIYLKERYNLSEKECDHLFQYIKIDFIRNLLHNECLKMDS
jgi:hypothetical protein